MKRIRDSSIGKAAAVAAGMTAGAEASNFSGFVDVQNTFAGSSETDTVPNAGPLANQTLTLNYGGTLFQSLTEAQLAYLIPGFKIKGHTILPDGRLSVLADVTEDFRSASLPSTDNADDLIANTTNQFAARLGLALKVYGAQLGAEMPVWGKLSGDLTFKYDNGNTHLEVARDGTLRPSARAFLSTPSGARFLAEYLKFVGHQTETDVINGGINPVDYELISKRLEGRVPLPVPFTRYEDSIVARVIRQVDQERFGKIDMRTESLGGSLDYEFPLPYGTRASIGGYYSGGSFAASGGIGTGVLSDLGGRVNASYRFGGPSVNARARASESVPTNPRR